MSEVQYWNQRIHQEIPATEMLGISIVDLNSDHIEAIAPLAKNINGHQTAFAGSIYTLGITTGWTLVSAFLRREGIDASVVAGKAEIQYQKPLTGDLVSRSQFIEPPLDGWRSMWQNKRSARQPLTITIGNKVETAAILSATFYIKLKE